MLPLQVATSLLALIGSALTVQAAVLAPRVADVSIPRRTASLQARKEVHDGGMIFDSMVVLNVPAWAIFVPLNSQADAPVGEHPKQIYPAIGYTSGDEKKKTPVFTDKDLLQAMDFAVYWYKGGDNENWDQSDWTLPPGKPPTNSKHKDFKLDNVVKCNIVTSDKLKLGKGMDYFLYDLLPDGKYISTGETGVTAKCAPVPSASWDHLG